MNSASADGEYKDSLTPPEGANTAPVVHFAPALILRRRTERSFIRAFDDIIAQLENGEPVPEGVSRFISVAEDDQQRTYENHGDKGLGTGETFFPLPANDAQRRIVERLVTSQGVLVQGPPGTGKSHTIVNLICHALATVLRLSTCSDSVSPTEQRLCQYRAGRRRVP